MNIITVYPGQLPECPECGGKVWIVHEKIQRSSTLKRVDNLGDCVVENYDHRNYAQSVLLQCSTCNDEFVPDAEVNSRSDNSNKQAEETEAYSEDTKTLFDFPSSIVNQVDW